MPRRLNFTNRKKINREDVSIQLKQSIEGLSFDADLRLAAYGLEKVTPTPRIYVEAYRGASTLWKRFDFARFGMIQPPEDRSLDEFTAPEGILFRVKVSAAADEAQGRLLAEADMIRPRLPNEQDGKGLPLIQHVSANDIGDEVWRVTDFDSSLPLLKINSRVPLGVDQFLSNRQNRALIMPAVMRQLLFRMLVVDRDAYDEDDTDRWQPRWLKFASSLVGREPDPPEESNGRLINTDRIEEWIDDAVEAFVVRAALFTAIVKLESNEDNQ